MQTDPLKERWKAIRQLEKDLAQAARNYGIDDRGLGFAAMASLLVDRGWRHSPPGKPRVDQTMMTWMDRSIEELQGPGALLTLKERNAMMLHFLEAACQRRKLPFDLVFRTKYLKYKDPAAWAAKLEIVKAAVLFTQPNGAPVLNKSELARLLGVDHTIITHYLKLREAA